MRAWALALLLAVPARAAFRSDDAGTSAGQFLKLGADARAAGMGQAARAACADASAVYWNPAALATQGTSELSLTHGAYYQSVFYDFLAYAQPVETFAGKKPRPGRPSSLGGLGVSVLYLNAGKIGEIDNTGTPTGGALTPQDFAATVAWGREVLDSLDLGVGFKFISSRIQETAQTGAVDVGARARLRPWGKPYVAALTASNLGGHLRFASQADPLPLQIAFSHALGVTRDLTLALDLVAARDSGLYPAFGAEFRLPLRETQHAALRVGYDGRADPSELSGLAGLSLGGGFGAGGVAFDYAWVPYGVLGHTHRLTLSFKL